MDELTVLHGYEKELHGLKAQNVELLEALKEIAKGEGAFEAGWIRDARTIIENMITIAKQAIANAEGATK